MGWASAGGIFDTVIQSLIESKATDEILFNTAKDLISSLRDQDWDTEGESLDQFLKVPAVVRAFAANGIKPHHSNYHRLPDYDLKVVQDAYSAATKGVWGIDGSRRNFDGLFLSTDGNMDNVQGCLISADLATPADLQFIAHAHVYVPLLLAEIMRLRLKLEQEHGDTES